MPSLGAAHLLVGIVIVGLTLDSRRFRALARLTGRHRSDQRAPALPDGNLDRVGLPLRLVQMRINVDWQDGAAGWTGPEVLPDEDAADEPAADRGISLFRGDEPWSGSLLPVLWKPFPALLPPSGEEGPLDPEDSLVATKTGGG